MECPYCNMTTGMQHEDNCPNKPIENESDYQRGYDEGFKNGKKEGIQILKNVVGMYEESSP